MDKKESIKETIGTVPATKKPEDDKRTTDFAYGTALLLLAAVGTHFQSGGTWHTLDLSMIAATMVAIFGLKTQKK